MPDIKSNLSLIKTIIELLVLVGAVVAGGIVVGEIKADVKNTIKNQDEYSDKVDTHAQLLTDIKCSLERSNTINEEQNKLIGLLLEKL